MVYELREQPWLGLYLTYQLISTTFFRLPYWFVVSYPQSWRPRESWSVKRSVFVRLFRHLYVITQKTGPLVRLPDHKAIRSGPGIKAIWVPPVPHLITGTLHLFSKSANVSPVPIPGYFIDRTGDREASSSQPLPHPRGRKILYRLHGGSYVQLSAHPRDPTANIARGILRHAPRISRTFGVEYRLSSAPPVVSEPTNPFPAALQDALAGYIYLVDKLGYRAEDVVISGDSAGGNLALALVRYLRDYAHDPSVRLPPLPGGLLLLSPWVDLGTSHIGPLSSLSSPRSVDYLSSSPPPTSPHRPVYSYPKTAFLGPFGQGLADQSPYISPASLHPWVNARFDDFPRTLVCAGGAEPIVDSVRSLVWKMERDMGKGKDGVEYYEANDAVHDYLLFPWYQPEGGQTLKRIGEWIEGLYTDEEDVESLALYGDGRDNKSSPRKMTDSSELLTSLRLSTPEPYYLRLRHRTRHSPHTPHLALVSEARNRMQKELSQTGDYARLGNYSSGCSLIFGGGGR